MKVHSDKNRRTIVISDKWSEDETTEALNHLRSVLYGLKKQSNGPSCNLRLFEVNWDDFDDVDKLFRRLRGRVQQLKKDAGKLTRLSDTEIYRIKWDAISHILNENISFLYEDMVLDEKPQYYVYAHCDTSKPINISHKNAYHTLSASLGMKYLPFYIGKGTGDRYIRGDRNRNYGKIANKKFTNVDKVILKKDLTESEALQLESKLIDIFGLSIYGGNLINIDEGVERDHRRFCYKESLDNLRKIENCL